MKLKQIIELIRELFWPLTEEERKEAGIYTAEEQRAERAEWEAQE